MQMPQRQHQSVENEIPFNLQKAMQFVLTAILIRAHRKPKSKFSDIYFDCHALQWSRAQHSISIYLHHLLCGCVKYDLAFKHDANKVY